MSDNLWFNRDDPLVPFDVPAGSSMPLYRDSDPESQRPQETYDGYAKVFDLAIPEQFQEYNAVLDVVAKGTAVICKQEVNFHEGRYIIYLHWMERKYATVQQIQSKATRKPNGQISFRNGVPV